MRGTIRRPPIFLTGMTLTQLRYIVAVEKHKNFARAAQECLVAQPTLSLQIQKLEQEIGAELFDRKKNPVAVTRFGREVLEQARVVLREADKIVELFRDQEEEVSGEISIGIIPTISTYLLPKIFKSLTKQYERVDFRIYELPTTQIAEKLERDELDLGILATPLGMKNIVEIPLYYEPFVVYFPKNYDGKKTDLTLADMEGIDMILLGEEHCFRNQSLKVCGQSTVGKIECGSIETIKNMVDMGVGMTLLPRLSIDPERPRVAAFSDPQPVREVSLVYRKGFFKKRIMEAVRTVIMDVIPEDVRKKEGRRMVGVDVETG